MTTSEVTIETRGPAYAAVVHRKAAPPELAGLLGECFGAVFGALAGRGIEPISAPFARFLDAGELLDFQAGAMVAGPFASEGEVEGITIPGGEVATAIHTGPYDDLPAANAAVLAWITAQGRAMSGPPIEEYITDPEGLPPSEWQTRLTFPLA